MRIIKKSKNRQLAIIFLMMLISKAVFAGWFYPSDYPECVDKYVSKSKSERAAIILRNTCDKEFKQNQNSDEWKEFYSCVRDDLKDIAIDRVAIIVFHSCKEKYSKLFPQQPNP
jgi:hypothetical protein